jgi:hypothetical protein
VRCGFRGDVVSIVKNRNGNMRMSEQRQRREQVRDQNVATYIQLTGKRHSRFYDLNVLQGRSTG